MSPKTKILSKSHDGDIHASSVIIFIFFALYIFIVSACPSSSAFPSAPAILLNF